MGSALEALGKWDHQHPVDIDGQDWWYRASFSINDVAPEKLSFLCFDGLATLAEVWLNGQLILTTDNMFRAYRIDVSQGLLPTNELTVVFRSGTADLKKKRPRPRWKTNLVNNQQLRWHRTSLLGRIPGWTPPVPPVGPWRPIRLERGSVIITDVQRHTIMNGADGVVTFRANVLTSESILSAKLRIGDQEMPIQTSGSQIHGELRYPNAPRWWPHTHGVPQLLGCSLIIETPTGQHEFPQERIGFRHLERHDVPGFALHVNGTPIYCRGACWTASNIFTLSGDETSLRRDLQLARDAGVNMIRIGGTMIYENDAFYRLCDELGILIWQDFMFANMDYPVDDAAFADNIAHEARQQLNRLSQHPCVAVYCGSSEIEQQAAMLGMPRELWRNQWFGETLPALCSEHHPNTTYVPSSPSGGVLPFHTATGITHYYGIGAYLRSMRELRQADVKFTTECVAFANIPEPDVIDEFMAGHVPAAHHPRWKQRVPRDNGSTWDFEDVRDHYLRELYSVDPATLRSYDMPRYLELSRVTSGEMMSRAFAEWRSSHSNNAGGIVYYFKDLWAASGWGIVDHHGFPKAPYYQLKRLWQTRQLTLTDEGLDGLHLHLINETDATVEGFVEVQLLREPHLIIAKHEVTLRLEPRSKHTFSVDEIIGSFRDANYVYRFGPQMHQVVAATWFDASREVLSEGFHILRNHAPEPQPLAPESFTAAAEPLANGCYRVRLQADRFLHHVRLSAKGFLPDDNYFHLLPGRQKCVTFAPWGNATRPLRATIEAVNLMGELSVDSKPSAP